MPLPRPPHGRGSHKAARPGGGAVGAVAAHAVGRVRPPSAHGVAHRRAPGPLRRLRGDQSARHRRRRGARGLPGARDLLPHLPPPHLQPARVERQPGRSVRGGRQGGRGHTGHHAPLAVEEVRGLRGARARRRLVCARALRQVRRDPGSAAPPVGSSSSSSGRTLCRQRWRLLRRWRQPRRGPAGHAGRAAYDGPLGQGHRSRVAGPRRRGHRGTGRLPSGPGRHAAQPVRPHGPELGDAGRRLRLLGRRARVPPRPLRRGLFAPEGGPGAGAGAALRRALGLDDARGARAGRPAAGARPAGGGPRGVRRRPRAVAAQSLVDPRPVEVRQGCGIGGSGTSWLGAAVAAAARD
mmetsp:Transcript_62630/g.197763  ORF Transcript_62630/g.197763 Transcript_62630/m.197763 type:complete len:352 (-) Transcript_62630:226-1281(-)